MRIYGHRRLLTGFVLFACLALVVGACGGGEEGGQAPPPPGEASGELRVVSNWTGLEGEAFQAVVDAFQEKNPKVTVKIEQVPFDQTQALLTQQFAAGSPPDVAVALPGIIRTFAGQDLLLNLGTQWDAWIKDGAYTDALRQIASGPDGKAYAVYFKGNVNALVWDSPKQLQQLGIGVPTTWAEFTAAMDRRRPRVWRRSRSVGRMAGPSPVDRPDHPAGRRRRGLQRPGPRRDRLERPEDRQVLPGARRADREVLPAADAGDRVRRRDLRPGRRQVPVPEPGRVHQPDRPRRVRQVPGAGQGLHLLPHAQVRRRHARRAVRQRRPVRRGQGHQERAGHPRPARLPGLGRGTGDLGQARRLRRPEREGAAEVYPDENDRKAAALWPKSADVAAGYDLDDWIGGEIQVKYRQALAEFTRDRDVDKFIATMTQVDTRATG